MASIGLSAILQDQAFQAGLSRYQKGIGEMEKATDRGASTMTKVWSVAQGAVVVGAAAAVAGLASIVAISKQGLDSLIAWGNQVNTLSDTLGTTGEQSSTFAVALNTVGVSVDEGGAGLNFLVRSLDDYGKQVKEGKGDTSQFGAALKKLGVQAFDSKGKLRTFNDLLPDLMDAFQELPPGINKSALAMELFGARAGTKFLDFLSQGSEGLDEATKLAEEFGLTMSTDLSDATEDFTFALNKTNLGLQGFWVTIGREVLPIATTFVNFINRNILPPLIRWAREIMPILSAQIIRFGDFISVTVAPALKSLWEIAQLLITGDFKGGIFGLSEDDPWIDVLFSVREGVISLFEAIQNRDWQGVWDTLVAGVQGVWERVQPILADMGIRFWDWIDNAAIPAIQTELPKLINAISVFLQTNGPKAWTALTTWGSEFWSWLTEDALPQVAARVFPLLQSLASWLQTNWDSQIAPAIANWADLIWKWLTDPTTGAIVQVSAQIESFTSALRKWVGSAGVQTQIGGAGESLGRGFVQGVKKFFEDPETGKTTVQSFLTAIGNAIQNLEFSILDAGTQFAKSFMRGVVKEIMGPDFSTEVGEGIFEGMKNAIESFMRGGMIGLVQRWIQFLIDRIKQHLLDFGIDLGTIFRFPAPGAPGADTTQPTQQQQTFTTNPTTQLQTLPVALQVKIGEQEIKEAVLTWSYEGVNSLFNQAVAQVTGTA